MNRKILFAVCCVVVVAIRLYSIAHGRTYGTPLLLLPFAIAWTAFMLPASLPVVLIEEMVFQFAPFSDGHTMTTILWSTLAACLIWLCPPRIARWFGTFDAVSAKANRRLFSRLPTISKTAANILDRWNRSRVGKGKMGGWA